MSKIALEKCSSIVTIERKQKYQAFNGIAPSTIVYKLPGTADDWKNFHQRHWNRNDRETLYRVAAERLNDIKQK